MRIKATILGIILAFSFASGIVAAQSGYQSVPQSPELAADEVQVAFLTNQARSQNNLAPLRMNWQLTQSTRWFAWDKTHNLLPNGCDDSAHTDSLGNNPGARAAAFSYQGQAAGENVWCVFVEPVPAVNGWLSSDPHRANMLSTDYREFGVGYSTAGGGWLAEDFAKDPSYAPVVINDEALNTTSNRVDLYVYNTVPTNNLQSLRPATAVQVSEDECMAGVDWQSYDSHKNFTLSSGAGWKTVYVRSRDAYGHTSLASDSIYYGSDPPLAEIGEAQMATIRSAVTLYQLDGGGRSSIQFSPGWLIDTFMDGHNTTLNQVSDSAAWDGRAVVLPSASQYSPDFTWAWTTSFLRNVPLVAYFRLKVSDRNAAGNLVTLKVGDEKTTYAAVNLAGSSFAASNQYIEVALPFTFSASAGFLQFIAQRTGSATVTLDAVTVFTAPQPLTGASMTWTLPDEHYRGEGIWVRYSNADGSNFTSKSDGITAQPSLSAAPAAVQLLAGLQADDVPPGATIFVQTSCGSQFSWTANAQASWLQVTREGDSLRLSVNLAGLAPGSYSTLLVLQPDNPAVSAVSLPVELLVVQDLQSMFLPVVRK